MTRLLLVLVLLAAAAPAAAQLPVRPTQEPDTTLTPEQQALRRLRNMQRVGAPDTLQAPDDSIRAQQVQVTGARTATPPPSPIARDSIMDMLLRIGGYVATEYRGDTANFVADSSILTLQGKAQVTREGYQLVADSTITYDDRAGEACGYGSPVLHAPGIGAPIASTMVCYDVRQRRGFARGARTQVDQGATWLVTGDMYYLGEDMYGHRAIFTDCDEEHPHYHFAAEHLKVVRNNVLIARNVTMAFRDVKVFWLPFMVQSLSRGRRSGILMPRFGINDIVRNSSRHNRQIQDVGMYWAINEYMGSELAMDWWADNYISLRGSFDYNFARKFLSGGLTFRRFWKEEGGNDFTIAAQNRWQMNERTNLGVNVNYTSSPQFVRRRSVSPAELNQAIESNATFSRRFDWGNFSAGANRQQHLSDNTVNARPHISLTVSPITLFEAEPGEERWYSNLVLSSTNLSTRMDMRTIGEANLNARTQGRRAVNTNMSSGLQLGIFSISQSVTFDDERLLERTFDSDTLPALPASSLQRGNWSTTASVQLPLPAMFGRTTFSPGISMGGEFLRNEKSGDQLVSSPTRIAFSAGLGTSLYAFFPGVASIERIRHRVSPSFSYNYSPLARADSLQREVFTPTGIAERNTISFTLQQTFEGKFRSVGTDTMGAAGADTLSAVADTAPRRRQQVQPVMLLSINTTALVYDFVRAREDDQGFETAQITNDLQSDLLRNLSFSVTHDLWRMTDPSGGAVTRQREFAPHLSNVTARFSLSGNSWLFRVLRLGSSDSLPSSDATAPVQGDTIEAGPAVDHTRPELGMIGTHRRDAPGSPQGAVGAWNAQLNYSLTRPRDADASAFQSQENAMLRGTFTFQATENWSVNWQTAYSFTTNEFTDHTLQLTRRLHDWDANFNFVKSQNGNFVFNFGVHLRANPDIKLDYSQSDLQGIQQPRRF